MELLTITATVVAVLVGVAAIVLNVLHIRLARHQLANADLERQRLLVEIEKLAVERDRLRRLLSGDSQVR